MAPGTSLPLWDQRLSWASPLLSGPLLGGCPDAQRGYGCHLTPGSDFTPSLWVKAPSGMMAVGRRRDIFLPLTTFMPEKCAWFDGPEGVGGLRTSLGSSWEEGRWEWWS